VSYTISNSFYLGHAMATAPALILTPKYQLLGVTLASGWTLVEQLQKPHGLSGGNFGVGYHATMGDRIAFVKAVDFVEAMRAPDVLAKMQQLTNEAQFEREVLEYCTSKGMSKVIRFIGHEYYASNPIDPLSRVSCLIMEAGDKDLRRLVHMDGLSTCAWNMQVMRDISQALAQLHKGNIAHGDIKPSNVIAANTDATEMKVGDLGRVVRNDKSGPFDSMRWTGDLNYTPPEAWYGNIPGAMPTGWNNTREATDAYMLGNLLVYLFTNASLQSLVMNEIPSGFKPGEWRGNYDDNLIAVLIDAHSKVLNKYLAPELDGDMKDAVMAIARDLTHPDPVKRGDKRARSHIHKLVGIDRVYQKFESLAARCAAAARIRLKRSK
jgi:serine/threonine protein kinase